MQTEQRTVNIPLKVEERAEGKPLKVKGYASVFNSLSANLGGFREMVDPNAFSDVMENDVRCVFNHDANLILGRSSAGTLKLSIDGTGLMYEVDLPNNTLGNDLYESVSRGDIAESSFKFTVMDDKWTEDENGEIVRTILKFGRLIDVSPVTYPAYPDATVAVRSLEEFKDSKKDHTLQLKRMAIELESLII